MSLSRIKTLWPGLVYYKHQLDGIRKMLQLERKGTPFDELDDTPAGVAKGGFQCDDMGLGKTIQILATMRQNPKPRTLILCPLALIDNWTQNAAKGGFTVLVKDEGSDWASFAEGGLEEVYVTNYDAVLNRESMLMLSWDRIVLDEAHCIRNHKTKKTKKILEIAQEVEIKWAVTGTPIVNNQKDAVTLFAFLGVPTKESMTWLPAYYEPLMNEMVIHRSMEEMRKVLSTCPPVPVIDKQVVAFKSVEEEAFYRQLQDLKTKIKFAYEKGDDMSVLTLLLRLRQSSVTPEILMPEWKESSSKMDALKELVEAEEDEKFLVFCSFQEEMELLKEFLGEGVEMYHGGLTEKARRDVLERARDPSCRVLLIQIQCGGCGLNLQEFSRVVFMSPWWTSALMDQAIARSVRMGQTKKVIVTHLLLKEEMGLNIDEMTHQVAEAKRELLVKFFDQRCVV
jgi:SNF2 family DNA or RNA helicase